MQNISSLFSVCYLFANGHFRLAQTGGNFGGFQKLAPRYYSLSYPVAAISADGTSVVQKHSNQNGM